jgi:hypothetical protein
MTTIFEGRMKVDACEMGKKIGKNGSNLKKASKAAGHGAFIVAYNSNDWERSGMKLGEYVRSAFADPKTGRVRNNKADSFYISAGSADAVRLAAKLLKDPVRPEETVPVIPESIGTIIGRKGAGIRHICSLAGDQCYIVHKHEKGGFVVTADTKSAVRRAIQKIKDGERKYIENQRNFKKKKKVKETTSSTNSESSNRYEGLELSSDEEDTAVENSSPKIDLGFQRVGSISSRKNIQRQNWNIRNQLLNQKVDNLEKAGEMIAARNLTIHDISWDEVSSFQSDQDKSKRVRRIQLSVEKKVPKKEEYVPLTNSTTLARQDTIAQGQWANGISEDVLSNEGIKSMKKVDPKPLATFRSFKPFTGSWADAADSDDSDDSDVEEVDLC